MFLVTVAFAYTASSSVPAAPVTVQIPLASFCSELPLIEHTVGVLVVNEMGWPAIVLAPTSVSGVESSGSVPGLRKVSTCGFLGMTNSWDCDAAA